MFIWGSGGDSASGSLESGDAGERVSAGGASYYTSHCFSINWGVKTNKI